MHVCTQLAEVRVSIACNLPIPQKAYLDSALTLPCMWCTALLGTDHSPQAEDFAANAAAAAILAVLLVCVAAAVAADA